MKGSDYYISVDQLNIPNSNLPVAILQTNPFVAQPTLELNYFVNAVYRDNVNDNWTNVPNAFTPLEIPPEYGLGSDQNTINNVLSYIDTNDGTGTRLYYIYSFDFLQYIVNFAFGITSAAVSADITANQGAGSVVNPDVLLKIEDGFATIYLGVDYADGRS